ncbi:putative ATP-dependent endonuclease, OLD family [Candidatus Electrothrix aarhusensis]|uniref:Putative ATP-dependent endonuclease, OLD family n=1 Tax=Candidatus Electrothrix aarhusensis TaxID=1859131 RepID=A0A3S3QIU0_9BACT|nr:putative ATP-dependent endonuclease, OLD family [Candidatus Electrothrix aarhusensis]
MEQQGIIIPNLAIAGYRSFGREPQCFDQFAKINLFIGQNNAGKSNVLRFLSEVYPQLWPMLAKVPRRELTLGELDRHLLGNPPLLLGLGEKIDTDELPSKHRLIHHVTNPQQISRAAKLLCRVMKEKARINNTELDWRWTSLPPIPLGKIEIQESSIEAVKVLSDNEAGSLRGILAQNPDGEDREIIARRIQLPLSETDIKRIKVKLIPAIRRIGEKGSTLDDFDGSGIIDRLAKLQNPDVHNQQDRDRFDDITNFFRDVVDRPDAVLEIPYERDTILVHMDGKVLPIESLGTGIHEVVILAAAATVLSEHVVCIEEPELHLNPILQRKLIRYLAAHTNNQYFITTHSNVLMDVPAAEIYHIKLIKGASVVEQVTSGRQKSAVCEDLGYHPSDLLQANCIIWVEGPSDRIYLNWWLKSMDEGLVEGIHYSIMFYGGRLLSHLSNAEPESQEVNDFISLRKLNNRGVIMIDSDKETARSRINATKRRLRDEFDEGPGHAWITEGREIENYLPAKQTEAAIKAVHPKAKGRGPFGKYDNTLKIQRARGKETQANKVGVARYITESSEQPDLSNYDLKAQLNKLMKFIRESNPASAAPKNEQHVPTPA